MVLFQFHLHFDGPLTVDLKPLMKELKKMSEQLDRITTEVSETTEVIDSAVVLIKGFKAQLDAAIAASKAGDGEALTSLSDSLDAKTNELAEAVAENTTSA